MNSVARFLFFIVLSVALHLAGLFFDFPLLGIAHKPPQSIEVSYVSRSLGSFYPVTTRINSPSASVKSSPARSKSGIVSEKPISKGSVAKRAPVERENPSPNIAGVENNVSSSPVLIQKDPMLPGRKRSDRVFSADPEVAKSRPVITDSNVFTAKHMTDVLVPAQLAVTGDSKPAAEKSSSPEQISQPQSVDARLALAPVTEKKIASWKISTDAIPRYDLNPVPHYPEVARLRSWEGKVVYEALILKSGRVGHLNLLASSGHRSLDNAARKAISHWQFKPAISSGRTIDSQVEIPITFSLKDL